MTDAKATLSLVDLDFNAACEQAHEFEVNSPKTGKPMGVFISVLGDGAAVVREFSIREANKRRKALDASTFEEDQSIMVEACVMRTAGWRGITESFSLENARKLYVVNPFIRRQVWEESNRVGNFTKV